MMQKFFSAQLAIALISVPTVLLTLGSGSNYKIEPSTVTGGGAMVAEGNGFELRGHVEVALVENATSNGYALTSGFWQPLAPTDCNEDGYVSLFDYSAFAICLTGPDAQFAAGCACFDVNQDSAIDMADFAASQAAFSGP